MCRGIVGDGKLEWFNFCKKLGDENFIHMISIASGVLRPASSSELQRKDLYAEHLRRNSKYLREYSFKKINLHSQYALRVSIFYRNKRT